LQPELLGEPVIVGRIRGIFGGFSIRISIFDRWTALWFSTRQATFFRLGRMEVACPDLRWPAGFASRRSFVWEGKMRFFAWKHIIFMGMGGNRGRGWDILIQLGVGNKQRKEKGLLRGWSPWLNSSMHSVRDCREIFCKDGAPSTE
jgi:hypothetical protein